MRKHSEDASGESSRGKIAHGLTGGTPIHVFELIGGQRMDTLGKTATFLGVAGVIFGAGVAWNKLDAKIDALGVRVATIEKDGADELCLQVLSRQMEAIEQERPAVKSQLDTLARERGCVTDYGAHLATYEEPLTPEEMEASRQRFREMLGDIDKILDERSKENTLEPNGSGDMPTLESFDPSAFQPSD